MRDKKIRYIMSAVIALMVMFSCCAFAENREQVAQLKDVMVLFTSDVHCGVDQNFTYAGLLALKNAAEATGDHVLLVDNGDSLQGEAIGLVTQGMADIELMNAVGYDIAIPGNHEFDYGMDRFFKLAEAADFPYISCNFRKEGKLVFAPYIIREFDGVKIAFVGATTPQTLSSSTPRNFQDADGNYIYDFTQGNGGADFYAAVQKATDDARAEGAAYVILIAHLGDDASAKPYTYADVIEHTAGIDAVLDGHSHDTEKVVMKNKDGATVIRQACGTKLSCIGWLRISPANGSVDTGLYTWNNEKTAPELLGIWNRMSVQLALQKAKIADKLTETAGTTNVELTINDPETLDKSGQPVRIIRCAETNLGDLCADAFRGITGADIGIANGGSIRTGIRKGTITLNDLIAVFSFGNKVITAEVTGQQILDALEWGTRVVPEESGAFLHVSGMTYEIHTYVESSCQADENGMFSGVAGARRVKNVKVGGEPLDPEKKYTIAGQTYSITDDGSGQTAFRGAKILSECELVDYEILAKYIRDTLGGKIGEEYADPYGQGRIVAVKEGSTGSEPEPTASPDTAANLPELPEGVVPVTWEPSEEHLIIQTPEAKALYDRISAGDYPSVEELMNDPTVKQLDILAAYYSAMYGDTSLINTPEREKLRKDILEQYLGKGSARKNSDQKYVYDGELKKNYQCVLVLGLPASGKSTKMADPLSEEFGAFILDSDEIKEMIPEFRESHGAAADTVHEESKAILQNVINAFTTGDMQGYNVVIPAVGSSLDSLMRRFIVPFEEAGYNVKVTYVDAKLNESLARAVRRGLKTGRILSSYVIIEYGNKPEEVYQTLLTMTNSRGEPYGLEDNSEPEEEEAPAA